jgi:hypothetical protein
MIWKLRPGGRIISPRTVQLLLHKDIDLNPGRESYSDTLSAALVGSRTQIVHPV